MEGFSNHFAQDDYNQVNELYFNEIRNKGMLKADPSGWLDTFSNARKHLPQLRFTNKSVQRYHSDESHHLGEMKEAINSLVSAWDNCLYSYEEVTYCQSVTVASLITLAVLKKLGIKNILFETPAYFASIVQAEDLGLNPILIPTHYDNQFSLKLDHKTIKHYSPCALYITQPRMSLGYNQNKQHVYDLYSLLSQKDYLVIDEATEQYFPSHLAEINHKNTGENIIKLRSMFKGMGLNGIRMSFIIHSAGIRDEMAFEMEVCQGALDYFSFTMAHHMSFDINKFKIMLQVANEQVTTLRKKTSDLIYGSRLSNSKLTNGYIGCLFVDLSNASGNHESKREKLLKYCAQKKIPVILGAHMKFAFHKDMEFVRLNYFNRKNHIIEGAKILSKLIL